MKLTTLIALLMLLWLPAALADEPPAKKGGNEGGLTEGLMDLLKEPAKPAPAAPPKSNSQTAEQDKATGGEDIGQGPSNPLAEVELGMNTLAGWMRSRSDAARTKQLQRDVVLRLDELIGQLEKQSPSASQSSSSSSSASQTSTSRASSQTQSQPQTPSPAQSKQATNPQSSSAQRPGQSETKPTDQSTGEQPGLNNQARSDLPNKQNEAVKAMTLRHPKASRSFSNAFAQCHG